MVSKFFLASSALALALLAPPAAQAASDADLAEIREQIRQLKESYEARIQALEQKLKDAETAKSAPAAAAPAPPVAAALPATSSASGIAAFNPAISAVLQGRDANLSQDPSKFAIRGFAPSGDIGPGRRGVFLGGSELAISAHCHHLVAGNPILSLPPQNPV